MSVHLENFKKIVVGARQGKLAKEGKEKLDKQTVVVINILFNFHYASLYMYVIRSHMKRGPAYMCLTRLKPSL